ncbi:hypothetical protein HYW75_00030 [Candidatus Pacearchaeota archaeon]|nr:hypothetical protein [Candidatus Pacearchaeota archaeon]
MITKLSLYERMVGSVDKFMNYARKNEEEVKRKYREDNLAIDADGVIIHDSDIERLGKRIQNKFIVYLGTINNIVNPPIFMSLGARV